MTDRPIIFSGPMIRALLDGRKTMTRRRRWRGGPAADGDGFYPTVWDRVRPGDRLWVRESFFLPDAPLARKRFTGGSYKADQTSALCLKYTGWRPSIHMPRWASRLTLTVTATKIERLQAINGIDALAEGVTRVEGEAP